MAWELMNEPQLSNDYDRKLGIPPGSVTTAWVREMASFIREIDGGNHLVSVGDEGWRSDVKGGFGGDWAWINDGTKGIDAATNVFLPEIDFMTLHVYAPNWGFSADKYHWLLQNFVADRAALAAVAGKPIVLEVRGGFFLSLSLFSLLSKLKKEKKKKKTQLNSKNTPPPKKKKQQNQIKPGIRLPLRLRPRPGRLPLGLHDSGRRFRLRRRPGLAGLPLADPKLPGRGL